MLDRAPALRSLEEDPFVARLRSDADVARLLDQVCVCIIVYVYVYLCVYVCLCVCVRAHACMRVYMYVR